MKKILSIIILSFIIISTMYLTVKAANEEMSKLELEVTNSTEAYDIYILLPKKYIMYAIQYDGLNIAYDGANTLKYNVIPSINVDISKVQDKTYIDNNVEYVQIKLDDLGGEEYSFRIISEYTDMDMLYRVKSVTRDKIMFLDNFTIQNNLCKIKYNYEENQVSTEAKKKIDIRFELEWWEILIIISIVIIIIYVSNRRNNQ